MKNQRLLDLRAKKIITTAEFMIFQNYFFGNFEKFLKEIRMTKKSARELWRSGMTKILKYKKYEIANQI